MKKTALLFSLVFTLILMNNSYGQYDFKLVDIENGKDIHYNQIFDTYNLSYDIPTLIITWSGKWCYPCIRLIN